MLSIYIYIIFKKLKEDGIFERTKKNICAGQNSLYQTFKHCIVVNYITLTEPSKLSIFVSYLPYPPQNYSNFTQCIIFLMVILFSRWSFLHIQFPVW